jgi:quinohemoprotein amine dehydrogenase
MDVFTMSKRGLNPNRSSSHSRPSRPPVVGLHVRGAAPRFAAAALASILPLLAPLPSRGQSSAPQAAAPAEPGFPISDPVVVSKCSSCHVPDGKGDLDRISWIRTTPEGWEEAIKRMVRLNGVALTPDEARHIVQSLSNSNGLSPEEARPVEYYAEHRIQDETFPNPDVRHACASCHAIARPLSWRRAPGDWLLLENSHIAWFPSIEMTAFQLPFRMREADQAAGTAAPAPVDVAIRYIQKSTPLHSPSWSAWQASMTEPKLEGRWLVTGEQPGKGKFFGEMTVAAGAQGDLFTTRTSLRFVSGAGQDFAAQGESIVYTGFQWRGRATALHPGSGPNAGSALREVMLVSRDQSRMQGRWFWGAYQEFGMDVKLRRSSDGPTVLGTDIYALKAGSSGDKITIYGDRLPAKVGVSDISLGSGVKVDAVASSSPGKIAVTVEVAADATPGMRTVSVDGVAAPEAFAVYRRVDFLKVTPVTSIAHLGGEPHAKGYAQFEAIGYSFGPDGKPNTADDIDLGPMPADWKLQEFIASYGDDDIRFVGSIDPKTGLFTPASDGPDPQRRSMRNNYGDVWAVATVNPGGGAPPISAKSYLIVSVPQYVRYDQPETEQ